MIDTINAIKMEETNESSDVNAQDTPQTAPQVAEGQETPENEQPVEGEAEPTEAPVVPGGEDDVEKVDEEDPAV